ncbi:hypothetical protein GE09DRAFT_285453 [Coniochaeta sp. 2T2.1]|nr:hypothetical protein GE09DRAFT_285453 [Coniochaeta sp. 2T2.1]
MRCCPTLWPLSRLWSMGTAGYAPGSSRLVGLTRPSVRNANSCVGRPPSRSASALCALRRWHAQACMMLLMLLPLPTSAPHFIQQQQSHGGKWKINPEIPTSPPQQRDLVGRIKGLDFAQRPSHRHFRRRRLHDYAPRVDARLAACSYVAVAAYGTVT